MENTKDIKKTIKKEVKSTTTRQDKLPVVISRGFPTFPNNVIVMEIGRDLTVNAIKKSVKEFNSKILVVSQKDPSMEIPTTNSLYKVGALCSFEIIGETINEKAPKKSFYTIKVISEQRVTLENVSYNDNMFYASYSLLPDKKKLSDKNKELIKDLFKDVERTYKLISKEAAEDITKDIIRIMNRIQKSDFDEFAVDFLFNDVIANEKPSADKIQQIQSILEEIDPNRRFERYLSYTIPKEKANEIDGEINKKINRNLAKQQKEFYLRERLRTIKEELGDISTKGDDADSMREKLRTNPYPEHIKKRLLSEINKMEASSNSNESYIAKSYIDTLLDLPWWQKTEDSTDLKNVIDTLNKNHYGLEKVKETIIEYLAIRMRSKNVSGTVICLVGPPGVGKTSLAKSIAEALGKKFAKISLGGMKDEAEIKGHRKTYVGAMPGRIIREMKKVGVINPLFLLDEIDKISSDHRGDPSSTLLDVLDMEQNKTFSDNYVEEDYDLSNVLFLATANYEENIPDALKDRLEIIRLDSYTESEKLSIAEKYLVPKILKESSLTSKELSYTKEALDYIIKRYTREAGVRELERYIRKIARKYVVGLTNSKSTDQKEIINGDRVKYYLKKEIFDYTQKDLQTIPGVVNGMAYTSAGGDLLPIEVAISKGKGKINITGNLKETMKESVSVALGYVKVNADKFGVSNIDFSETDFYIHVPSGGIPKDGPSAGVTLTTAIISALKKKSVPTNIAMTGEITLRGKVLIIGGVKEKIISAVRGGVTEIFIPKDDERFLDDIPSEVKNKTKIYLVNTYQDIYNKIFA